MKRWQKISFGSLLTLLALSVFLNIRLLPQRNTPQKEVVADTVRVTLIDTVPYYKPVPKDSVIVKYTTARLPVAKDTAQNHFADVSKTMDSIQVELPIEQKRYTDNTYTAYVSGYKPRLDSIFIYPRQEMITITKRVKPKHWSIGIQAGYGMTLKGEPQFCPYIGIGISYNLFQF